MTNISRRIRRLEEARFGTAADIEFARRLSERVQEARRCLEEARKRGEWCGSIGGLDREDLRGLSFDEMIQRQRDGLVRATAEREKAQREITREGDA